MSKRRQILWLLPCIAGIMTLTGCQDSPDQSFEERSQTTLEIVPMTTSFLNVKDLGSSRADYENHLPVGYIPFHQLYPSTTPEHRTIGFFMTPEETTAVGNVIYDGETDGVSTWKTTVPITNDNDYYIYGFMPREVATGSSIEAIDGGWSKGVTMTLQHFMPLTTSDVCTVVGLRKADSSENIDNPAEDVVLGNFSYKGAEEGKNRVFVLLKHLYSGIHFRATIGSEYHRLRTIKVTHVELEALNISEYVNITARIEANSEGNDPLKSISYTNEGATTNMSVVLYDNAEGYEVPETAPAGFLGCFAPGSSNAFVLHSTYNVYDSKGNLIRENCHADNKVNISTLFPALGGLNAGEIVTINLLIQPDYLYQLSDPDLDNPTIVITT